MKEFRGTITELTYSSDMVPPCLLHTVDGFGHLDRLEPLTPEGANDPVFQKQVSSRKRDPKWEEHLRLLHARHSKPKDWEEFDRNLRSGTMREVGRGMRDVAALSAEMGKW
jgi:hypothetical protein